MDFCNLYHEDVIHATISTQHSTHMHQHNHHRRHTKKIVVVLAKVEEEEKLIADETSKSIYNSSPHAGEEKRKIK